MATTTNFGWTTPNNTDLVKDGAAAIRTLGNGIDASFVKLKGGTTGQILSKASNTDLDYTWITNDVGDITAVTAGTGISGGGTTGAVTITNSMATTIDAKGDLIVGTGADTFDRLAVGTNGQTLVADSTASTGLKWGNATALGCSVYRSANLSVSNATNTIVAWDSEDYDTNNFHSTSSNTSRLTVPSGLAGKYMVNANVVFNNSATGVRLLYLLKNGTNNVTFVNTNAASSFGTYMSGTGVFNLAVGDYIEVQVYQNSGGALDLLGTSISSQIQFTYLGA